MPNLHLHWFLPTSGDSRGLSPTPGDSRGAEPDYLADVARAAERNGFESLLVPTAGTYDDPWLVATALSALTTRVKFLIAFRPGLVLPTLTAQQAATFQRLSGGRLLLNVVTGGSDREQRAYGDHLDKDDRYGRTAEFIEVLRACWAGPDVFYRGAHYRVEDGGLRAPLDTVPPIFFGGASEAAQAVAARHADIQLMWGEPPPQARERIEEMRRRGAALDRELDFGIRLHVIARSSSRAAWREADRMLDGLDPVAAAKTQTVGRESGSAGGRRLAAAHRHQLPGGHRLEIYPNLWAGTGLVRNATALVGSYQEVADRIAEYQDLGVTHFILSGYPNLEAAYEVGEGVVPLLKTAGRPAERSRLVPLAAATPSG